MYSHSLAAAVATALDRTALDGSGRIVHWFPSRGLAASTEKDGQQRGYRCVFTIIRYIDAVPWSDPHEKNTFRKVVDEFSTF